MRESGFDIQRVIELIAERKIEEAMQEGKFDDLPGKGKPLPLDESGLLHLSCVLRYGY